MIICLIFIVWILCVIFIAGFCMSNIEWVCVHEHDNGCSGSCTVFSSMMRSSPVVDVLGFIVSSSKDIFCSVFFRNETNFLFNLFIAKSNVGNQNKKASMMFLSKEASNKDQQLKTQMMILFQDDESKNTDQVFSSSRCVGIYCFVF